LKVLQSKVGTLETPKKDSANSHTLETCLNISFLPFSEKEPTRKEETLIRRYT
jgi:hypothetical protein